MLFNFTLKSLRYLILIDVKFFIDIFENLYDFIFKLEDKIKKLD
jgi:hypothetical protein